MTAAMPNVAESEGPPDCLAPAGATDLLALYDWIADRADPDAALEYTSRIEDRANKLAEFPERGPPRDDRLPACAPRLT